MLDQRNQPVSIIKHLSSIRNQMNLDLSRVFHLDLDAHDATQEELPE